MVINLANRKEGFVPNTNYEFDPPVETNCILVSGKEGWKRGTFSKGWCIKYEDGVGTFQGKPDNRTEEHFFSVTYGPGSVAIDKGGPQKYPQ